MAPTFYNDSDQHAVAWLKNLADAGKIPAGVVDGRGIEALSADVLRGFAAAHFFAGIGGWPLALRLAGWPDGRPVWTGSCPCQPYSAAGKGKGDADPRNLWPEFFRLIRECRPDTIFGEQVENAIGHGWLDGISADLEGEGYAVGAVVLGAHSVGAPHRRQRLYWVAKSQGERGRADIGAVRSGEAQRLRGPQGQDERRSGEQTGRTGDSRPTGGAGDADGSREVALRGVSQGAGVERPGSPLGLGDSIGPGREGRGTGLRGGPDDRGRGIAAPPAGDAGGPWDAFDLIPCRDGKSRRVEPGTFPLAHGISSGLGLVWATCIHLARNEVIRYAASTGVDPREVLRMVREGYGTEAIQRSAGGSGPLPPSAFLLDFLLYLEPACHGTADGRRIQEAGSQDEEGELRGVRSAGRVRRTPRGRRSAEQQSGELAKSLPELSWLLARRAQTLWEAAIGTDAEVVPLRLWPIGRVGLLHGYGNAIVPQVAAEFVIASMEALS